MKLFTRTIKLRLTLWYLFILTIIIFFSSVVTYVILARNIYHVNHPPPQVVNLFMAEVGAIKAAPDKIEVVHAESTFPGQAGYKPLLSYSISKSQLTEIQSEANSVIQIHTPDGRLSIDQRQFVTPDMTGEQQIWLYYRPSGAESSSYEILAITRPGTEVKYTLAAFKRTLIFAIPATLILAGCLSFFLTRKALRPVKSIAQAAREIEERDLSQRIKVQSQDELGQLAATLNQMFGRLQRAFDCERRFTADASHELRAPLSIIEGEATLGLTKERSKQDYQSSLELIHHEASHMSSVIGKLLGLAQVDTGREYLRFDEVNLKELLAEVASDTEVLCEEKSISFHLCAHDALIVRGDKVKLRELFLNLLDNAIRYTTQRGSIFVSLSKLRDNACIAVRDTGIGIPEDHIPHIFERFYRVDKARSRSQGGSGLGLSICQQIVELHDGKIEVESKVGEGSTFTVILPLWREN